MNKAPPAAGTLQTEPLVQTDAEEIKTITLKEQSKMQPILDAPSANTSIIQQQNVSITEKMNSTKMNDS